MNLYDSRILLIDDNMELAHMVRDMLRRNGYSNVSCAHTCEQGMSMFREEAPQLVVLDIMLPDGDGFSLFRRIRDISEVPILFLSAKDEDNDRLFGLGLGADDYITKPFHLSVVYAKTMALIRRSRGSVRAGDRMELDGLALSLSAQKVYLEGEEIPLTPKEYALLHCLMSHRGQILSREQLLRHGWGYDYQGDDRAVDTHIRRLREKLGPWANHIRTVIKAGYRLEG